MDNIFQTHRSILDGILASVDDIPNKEASFEQDCHDRIKIALFFDGTGNNREEDAATKSWSNIARLFEAARDESKNGLYAYYISGVGTKLNREELKWKISKDLRDSVVIGGGGGAGADARLVSGDLGMNDALKQALNISARLKDEETERIFKANESEAFEKINEALSKHRLIRSIDVSVFGFSRGAALARAFVNRLRKACEKGDDGKLTYESYPIRFRFLGVFDTVASFGLPSTNLSKQVEMRLPEELEKCVHYVAAHELRFSFPVDLIRQEGGYPREDWLETVFPGVHSDVGGGYEPNAQGKTDELARLPLMNMYANSFASGVRLLDWQTINEREEVGQVFALSVETKRLYRDYLKAIGSAAQTGSVEERVKEHMKHWYAYMGALHKGMKTELEQQEEALEREVAIAKRELIQSYTSNEKRLVCEEEDSPYNAEKIKATETKLEEIRAQREELSKGLARMVEEAHQLNENKIKRGFLALGFTGLIAEHYYFRAPAEQWMLDAFSEGKVDPVVAKFYDRLVHNSKTGILWGNEPFSYFKSRGMWESKR